MTSMINLWLEFNIENMGSEESRMRRRFKDSRGSVLGDMNAMVEETPYKIAEPIPEL